MFFDLFWGCRNIKTETLLTSSAREFTSFFPLFVVFSFDKEAVVKELKILTSMRFSILRNHALSHTKWEVILGHDFAFQKPMVGRMKRRSRSSDCLWLDHKPAGTVETGSILHPRIKTSKTGAKLSEKDLKDKDTSKYLLTHQSLDSDGEIATQLVKVSHFFLTGLNFTKYND